MKKREFIIFIFLMLCLTVDCQPLMRYRVSGTAGWLNRDDKIAGTKSMQGLELDRPLVAGGSIAVEFLPSGRLESLQQWNNASIGLAATYLNLGNDKYLGNIYALWSYINIPLVRRQHFEFGLRPGVGVAFADKRYSNTIAEEDRWLKYQEVDPADGVNKQLANISIGSVANAFLNGGVYFDFPIAAGWSIGLAGGWQHVSNGSILTPNGGYNMFNAELGVSYTPNYEAVAEGTPKPDVPRKLYDGVDKKWDVEIGAGGGVRSVYYRDRRVFGVADLSVSAHWKPLSIFKLGGGIDIFYDGAYRSVCDEFATAQTKAPITYFGKTYLKESELKNCFRVGVSLQPEFVIGKLSVGYHLGVYLYDNIKNLEPYKDAQKADLEGTKLHKGIFYKYDLAGASTVADGWFWQRIALKYAFADHWYAQLNLKLHIMKAEYLSVGLGFKI